MSGSGRNWKFNLDAMTCWNPDDRDRRVWGIREIDGRVEAHIIGDATRRSHWSRVDDDVKDAYFKAINKLADDIILGEL